MNTYLPFYTFLGSAVCLASGIWLCITGQVGYGALNIGVALLGFVLVISYLGIMLESERK